ncbi:MAG: FlgD immunoglobulin-like domain containing protein, partial [Planctomycetota bacterium]
MTLRDLVRLSMMAAAGLQIASAGAAGGQEQSGVAIPYTLEQPGKVVIVIDDAAGRRVRNLIADVERKAGPNAEQWDGRDDSGTPVPPGEYAYKAACTPPLGVFYEFTVNNAGDPPWWKQDVWEPRREPGGWMADHGCPTDAAAVGDMVFLASNVSEHGHCLIAVDLAGKKLWGAKWFQDLAGAKHLASDGSRVYFAGEGGWGGDRTQLFVVDYASFAVRRIAKVEHRGGPFGRPGNITGLAARDGRVYVAYNAQPYNHLHNALVPDALDLANTSAARLSAEQWNGILRAREPAQPWVNVPVAGKCLRIAWNAPQLLGAILSPHRLEISALKPEAKYPGNPDDDKDWSAFEGGPAGPAMNVYVAPPKLQSRALRIRVLNAVEPAAMSEPQAALQESAAPPGNFVGLRALPLRIRAVGSGAACEVSSGAVLAGGAWENVQDHDITAEQPAAYTATFGKPLLLRGLVVRDPFFAAAEIDVQAAKGLPWRKVGSLTPALYWRRAYNDVTCDFARDTEALAIRIRILKPAVDENYDAKKRTGGKRNTCSLGGVVFLGTPEDETPPEADLAQRITVFNAQSGQLEREIPLEAPEGLAFTPDGRLLAVSGREIVEVNPASGKSEPFIRSGLGQPRGLTVGPDGAIYVSDAREHVVRQFSAQGQPKAVIGLPGGLANGPYDPRH